MSRSGSSRKVASFVIAGRGFRQVVNDQIVTIFGLRKADAHGRHWALLHGHRRQGRDVRLGRRSAAPSSRVRGSVAYTLAHANWPTSPTPRSDEALARSAARATPSASTTSRRLVETDFPETATRVVAVYKLNSGYSRDDSLERTPGPSGRFDVQVNQRLPFCRWATPSGKCSSRCGISSATPSTARRSMTSCSSFGHPNGSLVV